MVASRPYALPGCVGDAGESIGDGGDATMGNASCAFTGGEGRGEATTGGRGGASLGLAAAAAPLTETWCTFAGGAGDAAAAENPQQHSLSHH